MAAEETEGWVEFRVAAEVTGCWVEIRVEAELTEGWVEFRVAAGAVDGTLFPLTKFFSRAFRRHSSVLTYCFITFST